MDLTGWIFMGLLFALSVFGVGIGGAKWYRYRKEINSGQVMMHTFLQHLEQRQFAQAQQLCEQLLSAKPAPAIPTLFHMALQLQNQGRAAIHRRFNEELTLVHLPRLAKGVGLMTTIGRSAPMIGLLGTVAGMIRAFKKIALDVEASALATDIGLALWTTAGGLIVAIPILYLYTLIRARAQEFENDAQRYLSMYLEVIATK